MTQAKFEKELQAMKAEMSKEKAGIEAWQREIKEKMADWTKRRVEAESAISRLKAEKTVLATRRMEVEQKWRERIERFKAENYSEERKLEECTDFALVKELAKRGWHGPIFNSREDMAQEHKEEVVETFNRHNEPEIVNE